jgi:hypothetical protein
MFKELILLIFLIGCLSISDAKLPQKGDYVYILVSTAGEEMGYWGTITDINQKFVCLNSTSYEMNGSIRDWSPMMDVCIGVGSITQLVWPLK